MRGGFKIGSRWLLSNDEIDLAAGVWTVPAARMARGRAVELAERRETQIRSREPMRTLLERRREWFLQ